MALTNAEKTKRYQDSHYFNYKVHFPAELEQEIRRHCKEQDVSINKWIISLVSEALDRGGRTSPDQAERSGGRTADDYLIQGAAFDRASFKNKPIEEMSDEEVELSKQLYKAQMAQVFAKAKAEREAEIAAGWMAR